VSRPASAAGDVLALCYHALSHRWASPYAVDPVELERQLRRLSERGYVAATFHDAVTAPPGARVLAVTFDDAHRSVFEHARPILAALGVPATVFACTDYVGSERPLPFAADGDPAGRDEAELLPMSWAELEALRDAGWEVGSHTRTHPRLTELPDDSLQAELGDSKRELEARLGVACRSVAYPHGDTDARVAATARAAGYEAGAALAWSGRASDALRWPRCSVYRQDRGRRFRLKVARPVRRLRRSAAWRALDR
jgi:peptidoglycan/xylan/chitin deacetylase (PgdA/CDA1 family)